MVPPNLWEDGYVVLFLYIPLQSVLYRRKYLIALIIWIVASAVDLPSPQYSPRNYKLKFPASYCPHLHCHFAPVLEGCGELSNRLQQGCKDDLKAGSSLQSHIICPLVLALGQKLILMPWTVGVRPPLCIGPGICTACCACYGTHAAHHHLSWTSWNRHCVQLMSHTSFEMGTGSSMQREESMVPV